MIDALNELSVIQLSQQMYSHQRNPINVHLERFAPEPEHPRLNSISQPTENQNVSDRLWVSKDIEMPVNKTMSHEQITEIEQSADHRAPLAR